MEDRRVAADLTTEQQIEIERIKAYYGLKSDSEAVRFLIRQEARRLFEEAPLFAAQETQ